MCTDKLEPFEKAISYVWILSCVKFSCDKTSATTAPLTHHMLSTVLYQNQNTFCLCIQVELTWQIRNT